VVRSAQGASFAAVSAAGLPVVHILSGEMAFTHELSAMLGAEGFATRAYASASGFLDAADEPGPACIVVVDAQTPQLDGLALIRLLAQRDERRPTILIGAGPVAFIVQAIKAGAGDFIETPVQRAVLLDAVRAALAVEAGPAAVAASFDGREDLTSRLSPRERLVLRAVIAGDPNKLIAYELGISPRTVEAHRANLMVKAGAHSLAELKRRVAGVDIS
jgi:two-component system response regulator FixJ